MAEAAVSHYCEKCNKTMRVNQFYQTNNKEKYPDGYLNLCKNCLTMHVDNWNPNTFLWILQEIDVPFVPDEWNDTLGKYGKDRSKVTGTTILGRYLSKMKLKQYRDYRYKDTEFLMEMKNNEIRQHMLAQGYEASDIARAIDLNNQSLTNLEVADPIPPPPQKEEPAAQPIEPIGQSGAPQPWYNSQDTSDDDINMELTDDDRRYLRLKWGKTYRPEEWVKLEQLYQEMMQSYDIQGAGHEDTLKMVCKTSLKSNQLLDMGDVDGAQKMIRMYDQLMKSGKFTAVQNKSNEREFLDSISELVLLCEREGFIPRFYIDKPNDKVDETLRDINDYTRTLVTEEMNLGNLIESAVKQMVEEESKEEDEDIEDEELTFEQVEELKDQDFVDFDDFLDEEEQSDAEIYENVKEGGAK